MSIVIAKTTRYIHGYKENSIVITDSESAIVGLIIDKGDEHLGWYVDTTTGNLELFQDLPELNLYQTDNRLYYDSISSSNITSVEKQKLYQLNILYKLTLKAIERVGGNPKTEGNICEFTDKCGQKWLLVINRAGDNQQISVAQTNTTWVVVGVRLC